MNALIAPFVPAAAHAFQAQAIGDVKSFIDGRRATIEAEIADGAPSWNEAYPALTCMTTNGSVDATFSNTFAGNPGTATLHGTVNGGALPTPAPTATTSTTSLSPSDAGAVVIEIDRSAGGRNFVAQVTTRARTFAPGDVGIDDEHGVFVLYERVNGALQFRGRGYGGTLTLSSASTSGAVAGSVHADLIDLENDTEAQ